MRSALVVLVAVVLLVSSSTSAEAAPPPWYPAMEWQPAADENFAAGRSGTGISLIVIHATDGAHQGAVNWFRNPLAQVSSHYLVRARDGAITQMVPEADTAFHVRGWNQRSIGIEHESDPRRGIVYTEVQYRSSAVLVCSIARRYGIPLDRMHVVGHSELPGADHADPGAGWNWRHYMNLLGDCGTVSGAAPAVAVTAAVTGSACQGACSGRLLERGARSRAVQALHWNLVRLGLLTAGEAIGGDQTFGPRTLVAVRAFQAAHRIPTTGAYGPLTSAALARALAGSPTTAPVATLSPGQRSEGVAALHRDLRRLGYMDTVTGFYGPITEQAVRRFQVDHGIDATGTYGPVTQAALAVN